MERDNNRERDKRVFVLMWAEKGGIRESKRMNISGADKRETKRRVLCQREREENHTRFSAVQRSLGHDVELNA